jgi:hypothetical protein
MQSNSNERMLQLYSNNNIEDIYVDFSIVFYSRQIIFSIDSVSRNRIFSGQVKFKRRALQTGSLELELWVQEYIELTSGFELL